MNASHFAVRRSTGLMVIGGAVALMSLALPRYGDVGITPSSDVFGQVAEMWLALPIDLSDGSVLDSVDLDGTRLTLHLVVDDRVPLSTVRDGNRDAKCEIWGPALHARSLLSVEYRYRQTGATSSLFLDRTVCG